MKKVYFLLIFLFTSAFAIAQQLQIKGVVKSVEDNLGIPGVTVLVKGTTTGISTNIDGEFNLSVPANSTLVFSCVGMVSQERVMDRSVSDLVILLEQERSALDEVIVVGYGVQKKSVVTAAITSISEDALANVAPVRVDNALKGLAAGVTVTSQSGQPGAASHVRIRGIGTINNTDPLYIVDGMPIDGGIDFLNPTDIKSIEVLKDAASGAVYGARAANGVVLVTTKAGKVGKARVTYDFNYGIQNPWRKLDVLNATEYAILMNEAQMYKDGTVLYDDPYSLGKGTDWQDEVFNKNAPTESHQLSISGADEKVNYYLSLGYYNQEGIVGGNFDRSNYKRVSLRTNATYTLFDESENRNYLRKMQIGVNASYAKINSKGIETNSEYNSPLGSATKFSPLLSVIASEADQEAYAMDSNRKWGVKNSAGQYYTIAGSDYNEVTNPLAQLELPGDKNWSHKFVSNFWAEINLWDNLKFKSSYGTDLAFWGKDGWNGYYYLGQSNHKVPTAEYTSVWSETNRGLVWQLENVLSYDKMVNKHSFAVVLGQSAKKTTGAQLGGSRENLIEARGDKANINFATGTSAEGMQHVYGEKHSPSTLASLFGRLSYNYDERYMFQFTMRRDGSSNFGPGNKWGVFPSFSLGWNVTNEKFLETRPEWWSSTKVRFSWGKNGNEKIGAFNYTVLTQAGNDYAFGVDGGNIQSGVKPSGIPNPEVKWEESEQTDLGLDFGFFDNKLTFTAEYYEKKTNGMLKTMMMPSYVGDSKPDGNVGDMENKGVEFEAGYRFSVGDVNFRVGANASYLQTKLLSLGNESGFENRDSYQNVGTITRYMNGEVAPYFYGKKTAGLFQNMDEINSYVNADGNLIQPKAKPGDVRFVDINNDGVIDDDDRTYIGKGMPDWTYGASLTVEYKGFDFSMNIQGTVGNDIYDATRRSDVYYINLPGYMLGRWTGEGTSNKIPRFTWSDENGNWKSSDLYVKDGSYMRLKNITLGYTLPQELTRKAFINKLRVHVSAENLLTFTKYEGFDPEVASGETTTLGIDRGSYPQARVYNFGFTVEF